MLTFRWLLSFLDKLPALALWPLHFKCRSARLDHKPRLRQDARHRLQMRSSLRVLFKQFLKHRRTHFHYLELAKLDDIRLGQVADERPSATCKKWSHITRLLLMCDLESTDGVLSRWVTVSHRTNTSVNRPQYRPKSTSFSGQCSHGS